MPPERPSDDGDEDPRNRPSTKDEDMRKADRANGENPDE
jgi:hypothetical protein